MASVSCRTSGPFACSDAFQLTKFAGQMFAMSTRSLKSFRASSQTGWQTAAQRVSPRSWCSGSFEVDGEYWRTVEHYFQAMKYREAADKPEAVNDIRNQKTAFGAKKANGKWKSLCPCDMDKWSAARDRVMMTAVRAKFTQNPRLGEALLSTGTLLALFVMSITLCLLSAIGEAQLCEKPSFGDKYWAGGPGAANKLGVILMAVRKELREQPADGASKAVAASKQTGKRKAGAADSAASTEQKASKAASSSAKPSGDGDSKDEASQSSASSSASSSAGATAD